MKILITIIATTILFSSGHTLAHPGGHGEMRMEIEDNQALDIVRSMTRAMTFKDRGYSVGKLDLSWAKVVKEHFELVDETESKFVYKATNTEISQTLFFTINKSGRVESVKETASSDKMHGHQH